MSIVEIILLAAGGLAFVSSFFLPDKTGSEAVEIPEEEIKRLVEEEIDKNRSHIDDMTRESVNYSMEKTERSLERLANEKIMALGEYSDNVLNQIGTNHQEVVFLHDMLNRSKNDLEDLLNRIDRESKEADARANAAYDLAENANRLAEDVIKKVEEAGRAAVAAEEKMLDARRLTQDLIPSEKPLVDEFLNAPVNEPDDKADVKADENGIQGDAPVLQQDEPELQADVSLQEAAVDKEKAPDSQDDSFEEKALDELVAMAASFDPGASTSEEELQALLDNAMNAAAEPEEPKKDPNELDPEEEQFFEATQEQEAENEDDEEEELSEEEMMEKLLKEATAELAHDVSWVSAANTKNEKKEEKKEEKAEEEEAETEAVRTSVKRRVKPKAVRRAEASDEIEGQMSIPEEFMPDYDKKAEEAKQEEKKDKKNTVSLQFGHENRDQSNHNERILEMHRMGRSNMAIAKDLGLGIGEVKLVIDLFENM